MKTTFLKISKDWYEAVGRLCPVGLELGQEVVGLYFGTSPKARRHLKTLAIQGEAYISNQLDCSP